MWCIVNLPNGTQQAVKWDPKAIGQECLEKVCKALGIICEMEYFGLEHWTPSQEEFRTRQWINLRNRLSCDSGSSGVQLMLALRVKFWVPVHFILQESVRNLFYMQAKVDLLDGRMNARDWANAAKLAALLCQADGIRFNEESLKSKCPIRMKKEHDLLKQQQLLQQQLSQSQHKDRKDKEYALSFKKRRLSKQKSIENIDNSHQHHAPTSCTASSAAILAAQSYTSSAVAASSVSASINSPATTSASLRTLSVSAKASSSLPSTSSSQKNSSITNSTLEQNCAALENRLATSPLRIYQDYIVRPVDDSSSHFPDDFLRQIAVEHGKLSMLKMTTKSAKYWLLQELQELPGYGEEVFSGVTTTVDSVRCEIAVGAHGITVCTGDDKNSIPFSAIAAAKSFRRTFKLEYVDDHNDRKDLEIKLPKHAIAAGLYRSITERHAFYVCDKVRGVVTNQFTRDLKGTIASMFKEDTELGKRYVFDIQHTCREVHDQARRILHERGIEITAQASGSGNAAFEEIVQRYLPNSATSCFPSDAGFFGGDESESTRTTSAAFGSGMNLGASSSMAGKLDLVIREKEEREAAIERCVDTRISEAMTCKICMDRTINTMFNPCCHVMTCSQCAARCSSCPNCRVKITSVVKIYLPPELRTSQSGSSCTSNGTNQLEENSVDANQRNIEDQQAATTGTTVPKLTTAA